MKKRIISFGLACIVLFCSFNIKIFAVSSIATTNDYRTIDFNEGWKFNLADTAGAQGKAFDDSTWRDINLPHDWSIELDFDLSSPAMSEGGLLNGGTGWYRKSFTLPSTMNGKRISIAFGGVYMDSTTYINGKLIANYPNGYTPFAYDLTNNIICDGITENVIAVKVVNRQPSSRWYSGSGIYRNVDLVVTDDVHIKRYGTFVTTPNIKTEVASGAVTVNIKTKVVNDSTATKNILIRSSIIDKNNTVVATNDTINSNVNAKATASLEQNIQVANPILWKINNGYTYNLKTEVLVAGNVVDTYMTRFGFRWFEATTNDGAYLNGEYLKLNGVCMHHDQGALGSVANYRAIERQMQIMRDMGVNAIRVSHNPAANELIEVCDKLGILVIDEAFDTWFNGKKTYDMGRFFEVVSPYDGMTWAEYDVKQMVDRGKNSPSIIMWSMGNEVGEANNGNAKAVTTINNLVKWVKEIDTTRDITMGNNAFRQGTTSPNVSDKLSVQGFNYIEDIGRYNAGTQKRYDQWHIARPNWKMYGSETASATKSRGVYFLNGGITYQQSSYGNNHVGWGMDSMDDLKIHRDRKYLLGLFTWTGFDYIGEPTPWHNVANPSNPNAPKSSYFGIVDTAGFPKDDYYLHQSQWVKATDKPMVHILPHWNWDDTTLRSKVTVDTDKIPVRVYTNAKSVELFVDDVSQGVKSFDVKTHNFNDKGMIKSADETAVSTLNYNETTDGKLYLEWKLPYQGKQIKAIAKNSAGITIATDIITKSDAPSKVRLTADRKEITADGYDLSYITVDITDTNGNIVPTADNLVNFSITGNGKIVGVDNGNAASYERYKDYNGEWKRKAFSGKAVVIVQSTKDIGSFTLTATSNGLVTNSETVTTTPPPNAKKLTTASISINKTNVIADDIIPINIVTTNEDGDSIAIADLKIKYVTTGDIKIVNNAINVYSKGAATLKALITYNGLTLTTNTISFTAIENPSVKVLTSYDKVNIVTEKGIQPTLPNTIMAHYQNSFPRSVAVTWNAITTEQLSEYKEFLVTGSVTGETIQPVATILVKGIVAVQQFSTATPLGITPKLPLEANIYYSNGEIERAAIVWGNIPPLNTVGIVDIKGKVLNFDTCISVRVSDKTIQGKDLAEPWNGSSLPAAIASSTPGGDNIMHVNNNIVSYSQTSPKDRWTNWKSGTPRTEDWVGIMFADAGERKPEFVSSMNVAFYYETGGGVKVPKDYVIQYYNKEEPPTIPTNFATVASQTTNPLSNDANWSDVTGHTKMPIEQKNNADPYTVFTFDAVKTHAIRVKMTGDNAAVGITEIKVYAKDVQKNTTAALTKLEFNDTDVSKTLKWYGSGTPKITATADNNAAVTIIPPINGVAQIIVTTENGDNKTYSVQILERMYGDADNDGKITITDALIALKMGTTILPYNKYGDFNNDGAITAHDVRNILSTIL